MDDFNISNQNNEPLSNYKEILELINEVISITNSFTDSNVLNNINHLYQEIISRINYLKSIEANPNIQMQLDEIFKISFWQQRTIAQLFTEDKARNTENITNPELNVLLKADLNFDNSTRNESAHPTTINLNAEHQSLRNIIGHEEAKKILREAIILPLKFPHLFKGARRAWTSILLYGPPGTGKSRLAQGIAYETQANFCSVSSSDLLSSWCGESEKQIRALFNQGVSSNKKNLIIFLDEVDGLCRSRSLKESDLDRRIKTELLQQLDNAINNEILILAATNCPWDLDPAFLRRFQRRIYIPLPNRYDRAEILKTLTDGTSTCLNLSQWCTLAERTEGFSGADLAALTNTALMMPIRELEIAKRWKLTPKGEYIPELNNTNDSFESKLHELPSNKVTVRVATFKDYIDSLESVHASTPTSLLAQYTNFQEKLQIKI